MSKWYFIQTRLAVASVKASQTFRIVIKNKINFLCPQLFITERLPRSRHIIWLKLLKNHYFYSVLNSDDGWIGRHLFIFDYGYAHKSFKKLGSAYILVSLFE